MNDFTETPDCCEVWPELVGHFKWMVALENEVALMPYLQTDGRQWRVNHCPSCGAERRSVTMPVSKLYKE